MSIMKLSLALAVLRQEKVAGVLKSLGDVAKAVQAGAGHAGERLTAAGHPTIGALAKFAPAAGAAYVGKKAYDSDTGQNLVNKYRVWKYNRAVRQAQQQQGYY